VRITIGGYVERQALKAMEILSERYLAMQGKRILITGCTGMIGKALAKALAPENSVFGIARFTDAVAREELEALGVECIPMDLSRPELERLPGDIDAFFHMAVFWDCNNHPETAYQVNGFVIGQIVERLPGLRLLVVGSTAGVCIGAKRYGITEETIPIPDTWYGVSKSVGEHIAEYFARTRSIPCSILRYWFPYTDDPSARANYYKDLVERMKKGEPFVLPAEEEGFQQPIFIDDIVRITIDSSRFATPASFILNVSGRERLTFRDIIGQIAEVFGLKPVIEMESPGKPCNLLKGFYDLSKLERTVGLPKVTFREGLARLKKNLQ